MIFCNTNEEIAEKLAFRPHFSDVISKDFKIHNKGIAFISFDGFEIGCIMTYKKSGRIATQYDRLTFRNPVHLTQKIKIEDIANSFSNKLKPYFKRQTESPISVLSEKVEQGLLSFFKDSYPDEYGKIKKLLLRLERNVPNYSTKANKIIAHEKDAVNLVFQMFNFEEADLPEWSSNDDTAPFLQWCSHVTIRKDPLIIHDSQVFGDWSKVRQYVHGAIEFVKQSQNITLKDFVLKEEMPNEKQRLIYVAISRPRHLLCLGIPDTTSDEELKKQFSEEICIV